MSQSAWWVSQFFLYLFSGFGVFFAGVGVVYAASVWDKKVKAEIEPTTPTPPRT